MENRCQRCNRELSDPNASYGWRCAEILGIDNLEKGLSEEYKIALANSIVKTDNMINGNNINLSNDSMKAFSKALLKQNFANNIGRYDLEREAREVGFAHEENPNALGERYSMKHFENTEFSKSADADQTCDLLNNIQGRTIGITTKSNEMNKIAIDVIDKYYADGFWTSEITKNGTYKISKKKLSKEQYETAKKRLKLLDKDGYTKEQRERR